MKYSNINFKVCLKLHMNMEFNEIPIAMFMFNIKCRMKYMLECKLIRCGNDKHIYQESSK